MTHILTKHVDQNMYDSIITVAGETVHLKGMAPSHAKKESVDSPIPCEVVVTDDNSNNESVCCAPVVVQQAAAIGCLASLILFTCTCCMFVYQTNVQILVSDIVLP